MDKPLLNKLTIYDFFEISVSEDVWRITKYDDDIDSSIRSMVRIDSFNWIDDDSDEDDIVLLYVRTLLKWGGDPSGPSHHHQTLKYLRMFCDDNDIDLDKFAT